MHKLIILFDRPVDAAGFASGWQTFLRLAEQMPGLRRESVSLIEDALYVGSGPRPYKIHEFYFADRAALDAALASAAGQQAGEWLHQFADGKFVLLIAPHQEATEKEFKKTVTQKKKARARSA